jgi:hypothetical protein
VDGVVDATRALRGALADLRNALRAAGKEVA